MGPVVRLAEASGERPSTVTLRVGGPWAATMPAEAELWPYPGYLWSWPSLSLSEGCLVACCGSHLPAPLTPQSPAC